jgi:hypothetical protein
MAALTEKSMSSTQEMFSGTHPLTLAEQLKLKKEKE